MNKELKYIDQKALERPLEWAECIESIVVIPAKSEKELELVLDSLNHAACVSNKQVGVVIVVNASIYDSEEVLHDNQELFNAIRALEYESLLLHSIFHVGDRKQEIGVGYARKLGMDVAALYFFNFQRAGLIYSLDADTLVSENYFCAVSEDFINRNWEGCCFRVEHQLDGLALEHREAMMQYEAELYYKRFMLRCAGSLYGFIMLGSAFVVSSACYLKLQGMGRQQAGEDFYFLQKIAARRTLRELSSVIVYPSARMSCRTPFGTGQAVKKVTIDGCVLPMKEGYHLLAVFFRQLPDLYDALIAKSVVSDSDTVLILRDLLFKECVDVDTFMDVGVDKVVSGVFKNSGSKERFVVEVEQKFNGLMQLRFINTVNKLGSIKMVLTELFSCRSSNEVSIEELHKLILKTF